MIYHNESCVTIRWDAQTGCVVSELKGFAQGEGYRKTLDKGLELLRQRGSKKWLGDMRTGSVMERADLGWVETDWTPRATKAGLKWTALVMPEHVLMKMQMNRLAKTVDQGRSFETTYFTDIEEAKTWLRSAR